MAKSPSTAALTKLVKELQDQRQEHLAAIAEIDATFDSLGIDPDKAGRRRGRKKSARKTKNGRKKGRGRSKRTGEQFITGLLTKNKMMTTSQINNRWVAAGRGGKADNTLSKMTRDKKVSRKNIKGAMGSEYQLLT